MGTDTDEKRAESMRKAVAKYNAGKDKIMVRLPLGTVERIKKLGYASGNAFAVAAILERLEKEENRLK